MVNSFGNWVLRLPLFKASSIVFHVFFNIIFVRSESIEIVLMFCVFYFFGNNFIKSFEINFLFSYSSLLLVDFHSRYMSFFLLICANRLLVIQGSFLCLRLLNFLDFLGNVLSFSMINSCR